MINVTGKCNYWPTLLLVKIQYLAGSTIMMFGNSINCYLFLTQTVLLLPNKFIKKVFDVAVSGLKPNTLCT